MAVIYDRPVLLNERQAGVTIEGALKQNIIAIQRLAVDTHGFTHFAMAAAKLLGFDLTPRLADLASRKLFLPHDVSVPARLESMVKRVGMSRAAWQGWDGLLHLILSTARYEAFGTCFSLNSLPAPHAWFTSSNREISFYQSATFAR